MGKPLRVRWRELPRWGRWALGLAAALAAYLVLGFWALPAAGRNMAESKLTETLHRQVAIERVRFNPLTFELNVEGVSVREQDGSGRMLALDRLYLDLEGASLFRLAVVLREVRLEGPYVHVLLTGQGSNLDDLAAPRQEAAPGGGDAPAEGKLFPVVVRNFIVRDGRFDIDDQALDKHHVVDAFNVSIPFTSSLPGDKTVYVEPRLEAVINSTPFSLKGRTLPFSDALRTEFDFSLQDADLAQYWAYAPLPRSVVLEKGRLRCDMSVVFERSGGLLPRLYLRGDLQVSDVALAADGRPLASFERFAATIERMGLLERELQLAEVALDRPELRLVLGPDGKPEVLSLFPASEGNATAAAPEAEAGPPFVVDARVLSLSNATVRITDKGLGKGFSTDVTGLTVNVAGFSTRPDSQAEFTLALDAGHGVRIESQGLFSMAPAAANGTLSITGVSLPVYAPYYADALPLELASGALALRTGFAAAPGGNVMRLDGLGLDLAALRLNEPGRKDPALALDKLSVAGARIDLAGQSVRVAKVALTGPMARLERTQDAIRPLHLFAPKPGQPAPGKQPTARPAPAQGPGWQVRVDSIALDKGAVRFTDSAAPGKAEVRLDKVAATVGKFAFPLKGELPVELSAVLNGQGSIRVKGKVRPDPLLASARVTLQAIPLALANAYAPPEAGFSLDKGGLFLNGDLVLDAKDALSAAFNGDVALLGLDARQGETSVQGGVRIKGTLQGRAGDAPQGDFSGRIGLEELRLNRGDARMEATVDVEGKASGRGGPTPGAAFDGSVAVTGVSLSDGRTGDRPALLKGLAVEGVSFASDPPRLVVESILVDAPRLDLALDAAGKPELARLLAGPGEPRAQAGETTGETAAKAPEPKAQASESAPLPDMELRVASFRLQDGSVAFRDRSTAPEFDMDVSGITASVTGFSLEENATADVSLEAMVDNHAPLSVKGKLMPLDREMLTEIGLSLANLDMTRLTPYTLKHIAYPVSTGQFSTDIKLGLKGKALDMDNLLKFHRFELGDKVDNPDAPSLPIKLGLALLSDRDGNMELDVPVQGRLDDPQFKLGKVIMGAIFNLIGKIITSPFALIGGMFGGGEDVNTLEFDPGTTALTPQALAKAESVAKALAERPRLKLEITGFADPASDGPALHEAAFQALLRAQKAQALRKDGQAVPEQVVVSAEEYPRYLLAAYENAEFKRPRNFLGMLKDQPAEEMERMLREHVAVEPSRVTDLAGLRAQAVREAILSRQGVAADRVFLRNAPQGGKAQPGRRVELGLK